MAIINVADYFNGGANGATNDATDCTPAFQAAFNALEAAGGGLINFPADGICRINGNIDSNPDTPVFVDGRGAHIRINGFISGVRRWRLQAQNSPLEMRNVAFLGSGASHQSQDPAMRFASDFLVFQLGGLRLKLSNVQVFFMGNSGTEGMIRVNAADTLIENSQFNGNTNPSGGLIQGYQWQTMRIVNSEFVDYQHWNGMSWNKTTDSNQAWVKLTSPSGFNRGGKRLNRLSVENTLMDEGATHAIWVDGAHGVTIDGGSVNVAPSGIGGYRFDNVKHVAINQSLLGYYGYFATPEQYSTVNGIGVLAHNVDLLEMKSVQYTERINTTRLTGTTKRVVITNQFIEAQNPHFPNGVQNEANALLEINGVKYRNGKIEI
jgi:hypothetical protein